MSIFTEPVTNQKIIDLKQQFKQIRQTSIDLCKPLKIEDYVVQPVDFVSPPKWNLAHVSWFFETFILKPYKKDYQEYNTDYGYFFNSYYESVGKRVFRANRGNMTRPTTEDVYAYRQYIDEQMLDYFENAEGISDDILNIIELGLHHEQQHQELLVTDLKYVFAHNPLFPVYLDSKENNKFRENNISPAKYLPVEEGLYEIGHTGNGFCFDNEKGFHQCFLHAFQIADKPVNTEDYLEFMQFGGYDKFQYWLGAGWDWVQQNKIKSPLYWHKIDGEWYHYTLFGLEKINLKAPVSHVSFYEADAYARWKGKRLPTEFEWETACKIYNPSIPETSNFLEKENFQPMFSNQHNHMYGDVWEWTNSAYLPYPYYKQDTGALGEYNGKFMINQMVLRGGSCVTPLSHIRPSYRNFFHAHERWQFTGIRMAEYL